MTGGFGGFVPREGWRSSAGRLVAIRHPLLLVVAFLSAWAVRDSVDWGLLSQGASGLFSAHPLAVYANTSGLQAGPPTLVVVRMLNLLPGTTGLWIAHVLLAFLGWYMLYLAERWTTAGSTWRSAPLRQGLLTLVVGVPVLLLWGSLAGETPHPEDGLAIFCGLLAMRAISTGNETRGAVLVGLAVAWKPWAIAALPMVLGCSRRRKALIIAVAIPAACWLPFILGDHSTMSAVGQGFALQGNSPIKALGISGDYIPTWWRTVELSGALACAAMAARRDWRAAFAAGCAMRLLLDPAGYRYYFAGLLMITALTERMIGARPWRTSAVWLTAGYLIYLIPLTISYFFQFGGLALVCLLWLQPWRRERFAVPRATVPAQRSGRLPSVLVDGLDVRRLAQHRDVSDRVAVHDDEVGEPSWLDDAEVVGASE